MPKHQAVETAVPTALVYVHAIHVFRLKTRGQCEQLPAGIIATALMRAMVTGIHRRERQASQTERDTKNIRFPCPTLAVVNHHQVLGPIHGTPYSPMTSKMSHTTYRLKIPMARPHEMPFISEPPSAKGCDVGEPAATPPSPCSRGHVAVLVKGFSMADMTNLPRGVWRRRVLIATSWKPLVKPPLRRGLLLPSFFFRQKGLFLSPSLAPPTSFGHPTQRVPSALTWEPSRERAPSVEDRTSVGFRRDAR